MEHNLRTRFRKEKLFKNLKRGNDRYTRRKLGGLLSHSLSLRAFVKLRKATISFVMSARPSARTEQLGSLCTDFHEICYLFFENLSKKFKFH
jgi:hypothetical protein